MSGRFQPNVRPQTTFFDAAAQIKRKRVFFPFKRVLPCRDAKILQYILCTARVLGMAALKFAPSFRHFFLARERLLLYPYQVSHSRFKTVRVWT